MRGGPPEAAGRLPGSASRKVAAAAGPASTASLEHARFAGRKRGPACPTRLTRPGPPPAPGAGCSGAIVARPACLSRRVSPRAGASCLRGTRAGTEDSRRGEDFFFFFLPGPRRVARSPRAAGSGGNRKEPPVRKAPPGRDEARDVGNRLLSRASGHRVCVEAAGRDLPAGRARPGGSRGPGRLRRAARSARLSPACARAGRCSSAPWRRELQGLRWHQCGCEMGMSVYLCVSVSLGLCRGTVSFSETHLATLHRPEPPRCFGATVMTSVAGLCLCLCSEERKRCFGVCHPPQPPRLFWQSLGDSRGGGCQSAWDHSKESQVKSPPHGVLRIPPGPTGTPFLVSSRTPPARPFFALKGQVGMLVQVGHTLTLCVCTCARSYPTNHSPLLLLLSVHRQSPHCQTSLLPSAKAFPAMHLFRLVK